LRRLAALVVALLTAATFIVVAQPAAALSSAGGTSAVWWSYFGDGYTNNPPQVYSNRNPTWDTGSNPHLRFETNGNLRDLASFCPNGVCWQTNTYPTSLPARLLWQGDGNVTLRQAYLQRVLWQTATGPNVGPNYLVMGLWPNGCLTIHSDPQRTGWGYPVWRNSTNPACNIIAAGHS
jgi:hypothetical protein